MASNLNVTAPQLELARTLLSAVGEVVVVPREDMIDAVTAVSGSGPAYVFYLTECLAAAGEKAGLPPALAMQLARATVAGSGELMRQSGLEAATLRQNVTSPKGTTYAALTVLMAEDGMQPLFDKAIEAATKRSRELAS
jgi:pyrroline-5-carboxylate reductase